jgi:hypothetical protein
LLSLIDPARMTMLDSDLLGDSVKAAIRSYLGRMADSVWDDVRDPALDRLVGECRAHTALLDRTVLPLPGRTAVVLIEVPEGGFEECRVTRLRGGGSERPTFTGQTRSGATSILMIGDSTVVGRITTRSGEYDFATGPFGLISITPADSARAQRPMHLMGGLAHGPHTATTLRLDRPAC